MRPPARGPARLVVGVIVVVAAGCALAAPAACIFAPGIAQYGYAACADDSDCAPGRYCDDALCAPPSWRDEKYGVRRALVVENAATTTIPAGAGIPVRIGEGGVVSIEDFGVDGRFTFYDRALAKWLDVPAFLDVRASFLDAWLPLQIDVPPQGKVALAWIESQRQGAADPRAIEAPELVFPFYDAFGDADPDSDDVLDPDDYRTAGAPTVGPAGLNISDNQLVIFRAELVPPVTLTFRARINGSTCDQTFLGLYGDDAIASYAPPSAGLFIGVDLSADLEVAPNPQANPTRAGTPRALDTALHRFTIAVDVDRVEAYVDDGLIGELDLPGGFLAERLYAAVDVDGACSVDVEAVWATPYGLPAPVVTAEDVVTFQLLR